MTTDTPSHRLSIAVLLCAVLGLFPLLAKAQSAAESWQSTRLGNIFLAGQQPVEIRHSTDAESINWTITDFWHKEVETGASPVTNGVATIKPRLSAVGYYLLKAVPIQAGQPPRDSYTSFAIVRPYTSKDALNNPFGVMTHFAQGMNPEMLPVFKQIGIESIRDEHYWGQVETTKGSYAFPAKSDAYMKACEAVGINPLVAMTFGNAFYDHKDGPSTPAGFTGYANYGQAVLDHYGKQIPWLEIWNEYNGTWAPPSAKKDLVSRYTTYTGMLKAAYTQIKSTRPDVQVLGGAAVLIPLPYFEGIFKLGGLDYMDGLVIHPYRIKPEGVDKEVADLNALVRKYNKGQTKPVWVTETGRHTKDEYPWEAGRKMYEKGRAEGARYLTRMYTLLLKEDVEKIYWYLASDHADFVSMGLLRHHQKEASGMGRYAVAPSYVSYANLIQQLDGAKFVRREAERPYTRAHVYVFQRGADEVRVAWATHPSKIRVRTAGPVRAFNLMGTEIPLTPANGELVLNLGEDAIFLRGKVAGITELDTGVRVLAASSDDYTKVQGENNWRYGYTTPSQPFKELQQVETMWGYNWGGVTRYLSISQGHMHPDKIGGEEAAPTLRWTSPVAGKIRLTGRLSYPGKGDGVVLHIHVDGREVFSQKIGGDSPDVLTLDVPADIKPGMLVDFSLRSGPSTSFDSTTYEFIITQGQ